MYITRPPQNNWEEIRMTRFTGSDMHKLLKSSRDKKDLFGKVAMSYIDEKVSEAVTGEMRILELPVLDWGKGNEPKGAAEIEKKYPSFIYYGVENPLFFFYNEFSGASLDGEIDDLTIIEIKCPENQENHIKFAGKDQAYLKKYKVDWYIQCQFGMMAAAKVKGVDLDDMKCKFFSYYENVSEGFKNLIEIEIEPDFDIINKIDDRLHKARLIYNINLKHNQQ